MTKLLLDPTSLNLEKDFDGLVEKHLGSYIYVLKYPAPDNRPFYVGKGGGDGQGNQRIVDHFTEARNSLGDENLDPKTKIIHDIWLQGLEVDWIVYRCRASMRASDVAELVESALIQYSDLFLKSNLTNQNRGKSERFYRRDEVLAWASKDISLDDFRSHYLERPIMLFPIEKGFRKIGDYNEALMRSWKISARNRELRDAVAIGLIDSISYCSLGVKRWAICSRDEKRYEIIPELNQHNDLIHKNFSKILAPVMNYWKWGCGGGGIIFRVQKDGSIRFIRGRRQGSETFKL